MITSFIAVEGLDGSGKSMQIELLRIYMETRLKRVVKTLHFPQTDSGLVGGLIARFLRGGLGGINEVNPYLAALMYAEDRRSAADRIRRHIDEGLCVITDRYVCSNIAYQCAKTADEPSAEALRRWILQLEYDEFGIPKPQRSIFMDVPPAFTEYVLQGGRTGTDRKYLRGCTDIHEADTAFQSRVREHYLRLAQTDGTLHIVNCTDAASGNMLPPDAVFNAVKRVLQLP